MSLWHTVYMQRGFLTFSICTGITQFTVKICSGASHMKRLRQGMKHPTICPKPELSQVASATVRVSTRSKIHFKKAFAFQCFFPGSYKILLLLLPTTKWCRRTYLPYAALLVNMTGLSLEIIDTRFHLFIQIKPKLGNLSCSMQEASVGFVRNSILQLLLKDTNIGVYL